MESLENQLKSMGDNPRNRISNRLIVHKHRVEWERELLGILSNYPNSIDKINFNEKYFYVLEHQKLFRALKKEKTMDNSLMSSLAKKDWYVFDYLTKIYANNIYSDDSMALGFAKNILDDWKYNEKINLDDDFDKAKITYLEYNQKLKELNEISCELSQEPFTQESIDEMVADDDQGVTIKRFEILCNVLKINVTDILAVAGTSGFGKSAFLLNIYQSLSQDQGLYKCHYFNLEVSPKMMTKRLLAITSDHRVDEIKKENLKEKFYLAASQKIQNDSYIASGSNTIEELKAKVLQGYDKDKINVVFVDHIGLLETNDRNHNRTEYDKVTYCMKELRNLALDHNCIVFVASQFDRASIKTGNVGMSSLKSSGEIENSSTHVLLLKESKNRPTDEKDKKEYQNVMIDIAKNRNGEMRVLDNYTFQKTKQIFVEQSF